MLNQMEKFFGNYAYLSGYYDFMGISSSQSHPEIPRDLSPLESPKDLCPLENSKNLSKVILNTFDGPYLPDDIMYQIIVNYVQSSSPKQLSALKQTSKKILIQTICLKDITNCKELDLAYKNNYNGIDIKIILACENLKSIERLEIVGKNIELIGNPEIRLENLKILNLSDVKIDDEWLECIAKLPKLESLILDFCEFTGTNDRIFSVLTRLEKYFQQRIRTTSRLSTELKEFITEINVNMIERNLNNLTEEGKAFYKEKGRAGLKELV